MNKLPKDFSSWIDFYDWLNRHSPNQSSYKIEFTHPNGEIEIYETEMSIVMQNAWLEIQDERPSKETQEKALHTLNDLSCFHANNPHFKDKKFSGDELDKLHDMYRIAERMTMPENTNMSDKHCSVNLFYIMKNDDYTQEFLDNAFSIVQATENFKFI